MCEQKGTCVQELRTSRQRGSPLLQILRGSSRIVRRRTHRTPRNAPTAALVGSPRFRPTISERGAHVPQHCTRDRRNHYSRITHTNGPLRGCCHSHIGDINCFTHCVSCGRLLDAARVSHCVARVRLGHVWWWYFFGMWPVVGNPPPKICVLWRQQ